MSTSNPFILRYALRPRGQKNNKLYYDDNNDYHVIYKGNKSIPLIRSGLGLPETKTVTEVRRERED